MQKKSVESFEELDESPKSSSHNYSSGNQPNSGVDRMVRINAQSQNSNSSNWMGMVTDGFNKLNEKRKQFVDPLVQKGVSEISKKWKEHDMVKEENLQQQRVLYEKLKKVRAFLDNLKSGSSYELNHRSMLNVDVDEEHLHDIQTEIDTMIQMTYMKPNYE